MGDGTFTISEKYPSSLRFYSSDDIFYLKIETLVTGSLGSQLLTLRDWNRLFVK